MAFLSFLLLAGVAYLIWRISDQLPDVIFRVSEIQRDVAEIRRTLDAGSGEAESASVSAPPATAEPTPAKPAPPSESAS